MGIPIPYNIGDGSGAFTGTGAAGQDGWELTVDLSVSTDDFIVVAADFDEIEIVGGATSDEAGTAFTFIGFEAGSLPSFITSVSTNTTDGTFSLEIDRDAVIALGTGQTLNLGISAGAGTNTPSSGLFVYDPTTDIDDITINIVICMARGTRVITAAGARRVEDIDVGDLVQTADYGLQPVRWRGARRLRRQDLEETPTLAPIRIGAGALGGGQPERDLVVSPQHRVLMRGWLTELLFGEPELLVPAKALVNDRSVRVLWPAGGVEYHHIMFDRHQLILTEGALTESFFPGDHSMAGLAEESRAELLALFPELRGGAGSYGPAARAALRAGEAQVLRGAAP